MLLIWKIACKTIIPWNPRMDLMVGQRRFKGILWGSFKLGLSYSWILNVFWHTLNRLFQKRPARLASQRQETFFDWCQCVHLASYRQYISLSLSIKLSNSDLFKILGRVDWQKSSKCRTYRNFLHLAAKHSLCLRYGKQYFGFLFFSVGKMDCLVSPVFS